MAAPASASCPGCWNGYIGAGAFSNAWRPYYGTFDYGYAYPVDYYVPAPVFVSYVATPAYMGNHCFSIRRPYVRAAKYGYPRYRYEKRCFW